MSDHGAHRYLLCYDISNPRRLQRIHRCAGRHGTALQYSIFECWLTAAQLRRLVRELRALVDENEDDVRIYGLSRSARIETLGRRPADDVQLFHNPN